MFWKKHSDITLPTAVPEAPKTAVNDRYHSALGAGTSISGKLSFDTPVRVDGKLKGEVYSTDVLLIGKTAEVDADLIVQELIVEGHYNGKALVKGKTRILAGAIIEGELETAGIIVEPEALLNFSCKMSLRQPVEIDKSK